MLVHILADMNTSLQPEDPPFTIADAEQHVRDYNAWIDAQQANEPLPEPSDAKPTRKRTPPYREMTIARVNLHSQIYAVHWTATPPRPVKHALNNGSERYDWGKSFVYFKYDDDARAYRDSMGFAKRQAEDARLEQLGVRL